jgi:hypothetical protein
MEKPLAVSSSFVNVTSVTLPIMKETCGKTFAVAIIVTKNTCFIKLCILIKGDFIICI